MKMMKVFPLLFAKFLYSNCSILYRDSIRYLGLTQNSEFVIVGDSSFSCFSGFVRESGTLLPVFNGEQNMATWLAWITKSFSSHLSSHLWFLSSKARPKQKSPSWSSSHELDLGQKLKAKLNAAEQKRPEDDVQNF